MSTMKFEQISITAAIMWEVLAALISFAVLMLILVIFSPHTWLWYLLIWVWGALTIAATFIYVPFLYLNTEFGMNEKALVFKKGVIFPSTQILYRERIVFVTVYHNPLTSLLKVSTLVVSAAGGSMTILFMNSARAQQLADILSHEHKSSKAGKPHKLAK